MSEAPLGAESNGGGGGIRTRVRKHIPAGIYDAYPLLMCRTRREEAARTAECQPRKISPTPSGTASVSQPAEMTSVPQPQAAEGGRSQVFRLRERAAYPQLGWFPSFNEGDGPRHASYGTVPPSKLFRPHGNGRVLPAVSTLLLYDLGQNRSNHWPT